jgi:FkbM family methyltransferase
MPNARLLLRKILFRFGGTTIYPQGRPKVVHVDMPDFSLLVLANEDVGRQIALLKNYEHRDSSYLSSLIRETDVCFDVGSNLGFYTLLMASRAHRGEVHAFDPIKLNCDLLNCSVALNGFGNITVNNFALGSAPGEAMFSVSTDGAYSSLLPTGRMPESQKIKVRIDTLSEYVNRTPQQRIDVMKMDVEGAEELVLDGGATIFQRADIRPRVVMLELYEETMVPYGTTIRSMVEKMAGFGYTPYYVEKAGTPAPFGPPAYNRFYNVFFMQPKVIPMRQTSANDESSASEPRSAQAVNG